MEICPLYSLFLHYQVKVTGVEPVAMKFMWYGRINALLFSDGLTVTIVIVSSAESAGLYCLSRYGIGREVIMVLRQQIMVLYLTTSALDTTVIGWAFYDGTGKTKHMAGDSEEPPYKTGLEALQDGWRLIQASPLTSHVTGDEFKTDYLKYEFFFEKMIDTND